ncbi:MAG: hypothetical protein R3A49_08425 [Acidimicrobiia bacterium]
MSDTHDGTTTPATDAEELPRLTPALLRDAETMCPLRARHEYRGTRGNRGGNGRYRVRQSIVSQARVAHAEMRAAESRHFEALPNLLPEEVQRFDTAAAAYVDLFADSPGRTIELDEWETIDEERGVRLVGGVDLLLEVPGGGAEIRSLDVDPWTTPGGPTEDAGVRFALFRVTDEVSGGPVRIRSANLRDGVIDYDVTVDLDDERDAIGEWLDERLRVVRAIDSDGEPRPSMECGRCKFVSRCGAHK